MSDYEIKAAVLGVHPEHGELISACAAKEVISHFQSQLAKANETISALSLETDNAVTLQAERNQLRRDLAKANERVKELEQELQASDEDLRTTQQQSSRFESALEEVQAVFVDSDACPLFEPFNANNLSNWLNKFAIEQKVEGYVKGFIRGYKQCEDDTESGNWTDDEESLIDYARDFSEQLHKEQE